MIFKNTYMVVLGSLAPLLFMTSCASAQTYSNPNAPIEVKASELQASEIKAGEVKVDETVSVKQVSQNHEPVDLLNEKNAIDTIRENPVDFQAGAIKASSPTPVTMVAGVAITPEQPGVVLPEVEVETGTKTEIAGSEFAGSEVASSEIASDEHPHTWPIDISDQFTEIIAGVPIIENPKNCGQGNLEIGVTISNIPKSKGVIVADLHDDVRENFLVWDKVVLRVRAHAHKGEISFCMPLTRPGDYAIAVYHDKNGNKEFDKNFLGIPKERFGMSSNPRFGTRSPKYEEAVITVPETGKKILIKLRKASDILGRQD